MSRPNSLARLILLAILSLVVPTLAQLDRDLLTTLSIGLLTIVRRQSERNTCGYASGSSLSSVTCPISTDICATNTRFGIHGCCDPASLSACTIPTTCIASTAVRTACTDDACSANTAVTKCTASERPQCYKWLFVYESTIMTQHGCAESAFTSTALRSYDVIPVQTVSGAVVTKTAAPLTSTAVLTAPKPADVTVTATATQTAYVFTNLPTPSSSGSTNLGAIIGGAVGGFAALSATAFGMFFVRRRMKKDKSKKAVATAPAPPDEKSPHKPGVRPQSIQHSELPGRDVVELPHPPQELDGVSLQYEASASPVDRKRARGEGGVNRY